METDSLRLQGVSDCHLSSDSVPCFYLLFCLVFIRVVIHTVTWLRSGVRLTGLRFLFTAFKGVWITRDHYSEYSFILITDFISCRISPPLNEIPLLPRCGFLVIFPRYIHFSFFFPGEYRVCRGQFIYLPVHSEKMWLYHEVICVSTKAWKLWLGFSRFDSRPARRLSCLKLVAVVFLDSFRIM